MNRNRMMIGLGLALVVAFLLSSFVYQQFQKASNRVAAVPTQQVVVAARAIPLGTRLDASMLRTISWPDADPIAGICTRIRDCTNRALITSVAENEPIIESKLAATGAGAGLAATIPEGMRAMSVAVNDVVGVAGFVTPGTMVDVLVTGAVAGPSTGGGQNITRTILENVRVLAAGQKIQQDQGGKPQTVPVITLLVTPEDAGKLAMASTEGKIQLALRNTVDKDAAVPAPVMQASLFASDAPAPAPVAVKHTMVRKEAPPPAPAPYQVEVIMGSKRETKNFSDQ
ncbi:MAG TPA: Flp pilus assembly protein CpaB [Candidatus Acidoferrales bacterium]|nr:Flp pilus assembly protein CpaB [Candidatus Acidoferrales bacterium]